MKERRRRRAWRRSIGLALPLLALVGVGCATRQPDLRAIYHRYARKGLTHRNPVILIPGMLGSKLNSSSGEVVWGSFSGEFADPETPAGARSFAHPMGPGSLRTLVDGHRSAGVIDTMKVRVGLVETSQALLHAAGLPRELSGLLGILKALGLGGYYEHDAEFGNALNEHRELYTGFQFDYDWRRDNVENAHLLAAFIREQEELLTARHLEACGKPCPVKFDLVAQSMGGLLARYYLRYGEQKLGADGALPELTWAGAEHVERVILLAPPNAGSCEAFLELIEGYQPSTILPHYPGPLLSTLPAMFQLLPRPRHRALVDLQGQPLEVLDPELWIQNGWGLADPGAAALLEALLPELATDAERREVALDHQRKCLARAERFFAALDRPARPPRGLEICLVAGDAVPTPVVVRVGEGGEVETLYEGAGDGTVSRDSALCDERLGTIPETWPVELPSPIAWRQVQFLSSSHLELAQDPGFVDSVLYLLLLQPRDRGDPPAPAGAAPAALDPELRPGSARGAGALALSAGDFFLVR